jgi:hypothetical protein
VVVAHGEVHPRPLEVLEGGDDVEQSHLLHRLRVVEAEAMGDARAAVMPGEEEAGMAEVLHQRHDVGCHCPLGVGRMVRRDRGLGGEAVASEVRADDGEMAGESGRDLVPHPVRLRVAVQQHERPPRPAATDAQGHAGLDRDLLEREALERHAPSRQARRRV